MEHTELFLSTLDENADNFFFQTFDDTSKKDSSLVRTFHAPFEDIRNDLEHLNQLGAGIFVCINKLKTPKRTSDNISDIRAVFVDLDGAPLAPVMAGGLEPHMVVNSGGGNDHYHAYWLVDGLSVNEFTQIQKALAVKFNADPKVCDPARVMRLPGFRNQKHGIPGGRVYPIDQEAATLPYAAEIIRKWAWNGVKVEETADRPVTDILSSGDPIPSGQRNDTLYRIACKYAGRGKGIKYLGEFLHGINQERCNPPVSESELQKIISQAWKAEHEKVVTAAAVAQTPEEPKKLYSQDDVGNANRFIDMFSGVAKHVDGTKDEWIVLDEETNRWSRSSVDGKPRLLAHKVGEKLLEEASAIEERLQNEPEAEKQIKAALGKALRFANKSRNTNGVNGMLKEASAMPEGSLSASLLNHNKMFLAVRNGIIDLKSPMAGVRPTMPEELITECTGVEYNQSATCPLWERFIMQCVSGDMSVYEYVRRCIGYSLTSVISEQAIFMIIGPGANGKSVFLNIVRKLMGSYSITASAETFQKRAGNGPDSSRSKLMGRRFIVTTELSGVRGLDEVFIKQWSGGEEVATRGVYATKEIEYTPEGKLWLAGNSRPYILDPSKGSRRRINEIPFLHQIPEGERDNGLESKLEAELPGILNWALQGCLDWQLGGLGAPKAVTDASTEFMDDNDVFKQWASDCLYDDPGSRVRLRALQEEYRSWSEAMGEKIHITLFKQWLKANFNSVKHGNAVHYCDIAIAPKNYSRYG